MTQYRMLVDISVFFTLTLFGNTLMSTNILYWVMSGHLDISVLPNKVKVKGVRGMKGDLT
jgi:hypothetical protein